MKERNHQVLGPELPSPCNPKSSIEALDSFCEGFFFGAATSGVHMLYMGMPNELGWTVRLAASEALDQTGSVGLVETFSGVLSSCGADATSGALIRVAFSPPTLGQTNKDLRVEGMSINKPAFHNVDQGTR
jgi:hypothetical protein